MKVEAESGIRASAIGIAIRPAHAIETETRDVPIRTGGRGRDERSLVFVVVAVLHVERRRHVRVAALARRIDARRTITDFGHDCGRSSGRIGDACFINAAVNQRCGLSSRDRNRGGELNVAIIHFVGASCFIGRDVGAAGADVGCVRRIARIGRIGREIGIVVRGVGASIVDPRDGNRGCGRSRRSRGTFEAVRENAITDEIDDCGVVRALAGERRRRLHERHFPRLAIECSGTDRIGRGQIDGAAAITRQFNQIISARSNAPRKRRRMIRHAIEVSSGISVLDTPAGQVHGGISAVMQFDEIVFQGRTEVPTRAIHLADDHRAATRRDGRFCYESRGLRKRGIDGYSAGARRSRRDPDLVRGQIRQMRGRGKRSQIVSGIHHRSRRGERQTRSEIIRRQLHRARARAARRLSCQRRRIHRRAEGNSDQTVDCGIRLSVLRRHRNDRSLGHTLPIAVANRAAALIAGRLNGQRRIRGYSTITNVVRALLTIVG